MDSTHGTDENIKKENEDVDESNIKKEHEDVEESLEYYKEIQIKDELDMYEIKNELLNTDTCEQINNNIGETRGDEKFIFPGEEDQSRFGGTIKNLNYDCNTSNSNKQTGILKGLLADVKEPTTMDIHVDSSGTNNESTTCMNNQNDDCYEEEEGEIVPPKRFRVDISVIESISKQNQATELQSLEGLSVYDQATLEAGILQQVDEALDEAVTVQGHLQAVELLEPAEQETDMERRIRLGEMTPFGTTLTIAATPARTPIDGLSVIEKYLQKQAELQGKKEYKKYISKQESTKKGNVHHPKKIETKKKEDLMNKRKKTKKKRRVKESLGTETEDFVPWTEKPGLVAGEQAYMHPEDASGSEYVPSESDHLLSSEEEEDDIKQSKKIENSVKTRKRKFKSDKPYKIPEDWASDDSDWEYSDEEGNIKRNKRCKKELDDGDVDMYKQRIHAWQRKKQSSEEDEESQEYHHFDDGYKLPLDMWEKLYNYQRVGVRWLWELDRQGCGGVLGDEMGLGKTIQVIAFLAGLHLSDLKDKDTGYRGLGPSLIVCPTTVMHQWVKEFHAWYPPVRVAILHESGTFCGKQRSRLISNMVQVNGILITSYTGATQHKEEIITRRWHYAILDEGHKIRNPDAQITLMVKQLRTSHRIILSGSPMQNNLKELWSLFDFVFPGKLGTLPVFLEQFAVPITQGGYANASQIQVMTAFKCATVLKDTISPYLLRRMKADVKSHIKLPEKNEQVLFCRLTDEQRDLYRNYVESGEVSRILEGRLKIFMGLISLRKICNHPDLYSGGPKLFAGESEDRLPLEERYGYWEKSGKMIVVETLLKLWKKQGHRVLLFTQSRQMLTIMQAFVKQAGYSYLKLDGGTSIAARQPLINKFNQNTSYFLMLLTTRVGGLGVNLTGANRVLIYDPDWNPATDTQARERAWRIGQNRSVTVYRLITAGTIEEKMYHRQIFKQFLCNKVLKDPRQRRFFKSNDLFELFTLKETDKEGSTETAALFAGTGSEVKLDPNKKYAHRKVAPRLSAEPPAETFSRKKAENKRRLEEKLKGNNSSDANKTMAFSNEKIEKMKKLAQMLSQKLVKTVSPDKNESCKLNSAHNSNNEEEIVDLVMISDTEMGYKKQPDISTPGTSGTSRPKNIGYIKTSKDKKKHNKKKRKTKDAKFEGETVPHLVKAGSLSSKPDKENDDDDNYATQDEYVLKTLFAKSGLQTAMKHDTIMEGGPADYAIVEGEADRVAKQAVEKLKESRRECWRPASGVANFTGINGARNFQSKPRFGAKSSVGSMSSRELLEIIRKRNGTVDAKDSDLTLVGDIREYVTSQGGTVTTNQLISRFEGKLPEGSSPLFKSLISKICTFYRAPDKLGYWTLKDDFNW